MTDKHLSSQFDSELTGVSTRVMEMGGVVEAQIRSAIYALAHLSVESAIQALVVKSANYDSVRDLTALGSADPDSALADPVARFHLNNGARLQRINAAGDLSRKGLRQAFGLMVNYLYDLDEIEANHDAFVGGGVAASRAVLGLM